MNGVRSPARGHNVTGIRRTPTMTQGVQLLLRSDPLYPPVKDLMSATI